MTNLGGTIFYRVQEWEGPCEGESRVRRMPARMRWLQKRGCYGVAEAAALARATRKMAWETKGSWKRQRIVSKMSELRCENA